jgi:hypothetical protein
MGSLWIEFQILEGRKPILNSKLVEVTDKSGPRRSSEWRMLAAARRCLGGARSGELGGCRPDIGGLGVELGGKLEVVIDEWDRGIRHAAPWPCSPDTGLDLGHPTHKGEVGGWMRWCVQWKGIGESVHADGRGFRGKGSVFDLTEEGDLEEGDHFSV